jgi:hypothetical protein
MHLSNSSIIKINATHLTLEAPVVLHYLKVPTAVRLTAVWFIDMLSGEGKYLKPLFILI